MNRVTIVHKRTISLALTADDWALYHKADREAVAASINRKVEEAINSSEFVGEAHKRINTVLEAFSDFGASDTEGWEVAWQLLDLAYSPAK